MRVDSKYTADRAEFILDKLAEGVSLREICREHPDEAPVDEKTVRNWAINDVEGFRDRYITAKMLGHESMADEIFDIADDGRNDWMTRHNERTGISEEVPNNEHMNRSRLRVDTRKWYLAKVLPKIYGDKLAVTGADGGAVKVDQVTRIELVGVVAVLPPPY
jgi:hypothetical protein